MLQEDRIAILLFVILGFQLAAVAEIMGLVNDDQIVGVPSQSGKIGSVGGAVGPSDIGVIQDLIIQTVLRQGVIDIVVPVGIPVVGQLLRAKDQDTFVSGLIILDDRQSSEGFAQADGICKDTAIVLFKFVDDSQGCIPLEVEEHTPNLAVLEADSLIRQLILGDVL